MFSAIVAIYLLRSCCAGFGCSQLMLLTLLAGLLAAIRATAFVVRLLHRLWLIPADVADFVGVTVWVDFRNRTGCAVAALASANRS